MLWPYLLILAWTVNTEDNLEEKTIYNTEEKIIEKMWLKDVQNKI